MDWGSLIIAIITSVLCIALATGRGRLHPALALQAVGTSAPAAPTVVHTVPAHRAGGTRRRHVILLWKRATAYILRVLRLRRKWASLGRHLATQRVQDLVVGLSRRTGTLTRIYDPAFAAGPLAKVRAQPRRRTPAATADSQ